MGFRTIEVGALQIKSEEGNLSALDKIQEELWRKTDASQCRARQRVGPDLVTKQTKRVSICKYVLLKGLLNSKRNMMRKHGENLSLYELFQLQVLLPSTPHSLVFCLKYGIVRDSLLCALEVLFIYFSLTVIFPF